jgi:hypothetical protein
MHSGKTRLTKYLVSTAVCATIFILLCRTFIPWTGTSDLSSTEWPPVGAQVEPEQATTESEQATQDDSDQVVLVVASQTTDNTTWLDTAFPSWQKAIYLTDAPSNLSVPANKGREGMVYLRYTSMSMACGVPTNLLQATS